MPHKTYENISYGTTYRRTRWGEVRNGLHSNNPYFSDCDFASGVLSVRDGNIQYQPPATKVYNRLYAKFRDEVMGKKSELLTASVEWDKSLAMVNQRTLWILRSLKGLKQHGTVEFVRTLAEPVAHPWTSDGLETVRSKNKRARSRRRWKTRKKSKRKVQAPSDAWLEYWLGWAPAIGDIYNALDILQREFPTDHVSTTVAYRREWETNSGTSPSSSFYYKRCGIGTGSLGCYADVKVTNYNLFLLDQMGLINPALTAFQIIPLSFILNWFINVEQVLSALTDFAGLSLTKTGTANRETRAVRQVGTRRVINSVGGYTYFPLSGGTNGVTLRRDPGSIPAPKLALKFDRLALTQAATSVSLLVNALSKTIRHKS